MARLRQILNALVVAIGAIIAWNERRDPARGRAPAAASARPTPERPANDAGRAATTAPTVAAEAPTKTAPRAAVGQAAAKRDVPPGAVPGDGTTTCPPAHPIKGNARSMIYHRPGQAAYDRTAPTFCFATVEDAEAAGYRAASR